MQRKRKSFLREIRDWVIACVIALLFAFLIREYLFAPVVVEGHSMMPTLHDKDRMILNKISNEYERFDVVVFRATEEKNYIKRVIGLPGDTLEYKDDILYINGEALAEHYLDEYKKELHGGLLTFDFTLESITGKTKIPSGHYFLMGDNRRDSEDSRRLGTISKDKIMGKTNLVFWPLNKIHFIE